jgi:hypothetical protein
LKKEAKSASIAARWRGQVAMIEAIANIPQLPVSDTGIRLGYPVSCCWRPPVLYSLLQVNECSGPAVADAPAESLKRLIH